MEPLRQRLAPRLQTASGLRKPQSHQKLEPAGAEHRRCGCRDSAWLARDGCGTETQQYMCTVNCKCPFHAVHAALLRRQRRRTKQPHVEKKIKHAPRRALMTIGIMAALTPKRSNPLRHVTSGSWGVPVSQRHVVARHQLLQHGTLVLLDLVGRGHVDGDNRAGRGLAPHGRPLAEELVVQRGGARDGLRGSADDL